jgi:threonine dehydrogenase-like Zn-dependent dehydrogenase
VAARVRDLRADGLASAGSGRPFDLAIDTSGRMLEALLPHVARGGDVILAGLDDTYVAAIRPASLTDRGIRLIGSIDTNRTFAAALSLLRREAAFRQVVTHRLGLESYAEALALLGAPLGSRAPGPAAAAKVVLSPLP